VNAVAHEPVTVAGAHAPVTSVAGAHRDDLSDHLVRGVAALPRELRDELHGLAANTAWLLKLGRSIRLIPMLFVLLWPFLLPWLVGQLVRLRRLRKDPQVRALLDDSAPIRRAQAQERDLHDAAVFDLIHAREGSAVVAYCIVGPPVILGGFALAVVLAGR
jgi:hypothetical protein